MAPAVRVAAASSRGLLKVLQANNVEGVLTDRWAAGSEYMAGLSWKIRGQNGKTLGEGGDYSCTVAPLFPELRNFWSACVSLERLIETRLELEPMPIIMRADPGLTLASVDRTIASLRGQGFVVIREAWEVSSNGAQRSNFGKQDFLRATLTSDDAEEISLFSSQRGVQSRRVPIR